MTPVFPYLVRRADDGWRGELLLRLKDGRSAYVVHLSLEQARVLAVEMRGLATDHCPQHHLSLRIAEAFGAQISHVVIKNVGHFDQVLGVLRIVGAEGMSDVNVDAAAALGMAVHLGLPIFMDGEFSQAEGPLNPVQEMHGGSHPSRMPQVFRDVIEELELPGTDGDSPA